MCSLLKSLFILLAALTFKIRTAALRMSGVYTFTDMLKCIDWLSASTAPVWVGLFSFPYSGGMQLDSNAFSNKIFYFTFDWLVTSLIDRQVYTAVGFFLKLFYLSLTSLIWLDSIWALAERRTLITLSTATLVDGKRTRVSYSFFVSTAARGSLVECLSWLLDNCSQV